MIFLILIIFVNSIQVENIYSDEVTLNNTSVNIFIDNFLCYDCIEEAKTIIANNYSGYEVNIICLIDNDIIQKKLRRKQIQKLINHDNFYFDKNIKDKNYKWLLAKKYSIKKTPSILVLDKEYNDSLISYEQIVKD